MDFAWGTITSCFLDDYAWQLGVWPDIDIDLAEGTSPLTSIARYVFDTGPSVWVLESAFGKPYEPSGQGIGGYFIATLLVASIGVISIIIIRTKKRC